MQIDYDIWKEEISEVLEERLGYDSRTITEEELIKIEERNREILDLFGALDGCAALTVQDSEAAPDDSAQEDICLEIEAGDPNQKGGRIRYRDGEYELVQYIYGYYGDRGSCIKVASMLMLDDATEAGRLLFDHVSAKKKTLRIPISATTYIESVYPFNKFESVGPEEEKNDESETKWVFTKEEMMEFIDGVRKESIDNEISEFIQSLEEAEGEEKNENAVLKEKEVADFFCKNLKPKPDPKEMEYIFGHIVFLTNFEIEFDTMSDWVYNSAIAKFPLLTAEEETELAKRIAEGDKEAWEQMINSNLRLVRSCAYQFFLLPSDSLEQEDLVQEGNLALEKAVDKFDYTKNNRFSTYATSKIRFAILAAIYEMRGSALGIEEGNARKKTEEKISKVAKTRNQLQQDLEREPSAEEIRQEIENAGGPKITEDKVKEYLAILDRRDVSLDTPIDEGSGSFGDQIGKSFSEDDIFPEGDVFGDILTDKEEYVLFQRDERRDLKTKPFYTDEEIAEEMELSPKGERQLTSEEVRELGQNANRKVYANVETIEKQMRKNNYEPPKVKLTERMETVESMITPGNLVVDLSGDAERAKILIALCSAWNEGKREQGIPKAIAMELDEANFKRTKTLVDKFDLGDQIDTRLSGLTDGVGKLYANNDVTLLVSGRPSLIKAIITKYPDPNHVSELVLEARQTDDIAEVRRCVRELGFVIEDESFLWEEGKDEKQYYSIIKAMREVKPDEEETDGESLDSAEWDEEDEVIILIQSLEDAFGPELLSKRDPGLKLWLETEQKNTEKILDSMGENKNLETRKNELSKKMELIEAALKFFNHEAF